MPCGCHGHGMPRAGADTPAVIRPDEPCVYCAEKHFATAYALANENGYEAKNRTAILGQLVLSQWHLWRDHRDLARRIRDLRHRIQHREALSADAWTSIIPDLDAIVSAQADLDRAPPA